MIENGKAMKTKYEVVEFESSILVTTYLTDNFLSHLSREVEFLSFLPTPDAIENYFLWHLDLIDGNGVSIELIHSDIALEEDRWKCIFYYRKDGVSLQTISNTILATCDKCNHLNEHHVIAQDREEFMVTTSKEATVVALSSKEKKYPWALWSMVAGLISLNVFFVANKLKHLLSLKIS